MGFNEQISKLSDWINEQPKLVLYAMISISLGVILILVGLLLL